MTHICVGNLIVIGSDNGLSPGWRQAIIWTNAGILLIRISGTNLSEILMEIHTFSFLKMHMKMSSRKIRPRWSKSKSLDITRSLFQYVWYLIVRSRKSSKLWVWVLNVGMLITLCKLAGVSPAVLPRRLPNFRMIRNFGNSSRSPETVWGVTIRCHAILKWPFVLKSLADNTEYHGIILPLSKRHCSIRLTVQLNTFNNTDFEHVFKRNTVYNDIFGGMVLKIICFWFIATHRMTNTNLCFQFQLYSTVDFY